MRMGDPLILRAGTAGRRPALSAAGARSARHRALAVGALALTLALALLLHEVLAPGRFPVRVVRFVGDLRGVPRAALVARVAPFLHANFYALNLDAVRAAVAPVPWVGAVRVARRFPRTLVVHIDRETLAGRWAQGGFVTSAGRHVHLGGEKAPAGLPVFVGPPGCESAMIAHYERFQSLLAPAHLTIARVILSARHTWRLDVSHGALLVLGHKGGARIARFMRIFPEIAHAFPSMGRIDLRYTNGFAVRWKKKASGGAT